jgi:hypothetical protein
VLAERTSMFAIEQNVRDCLAKFCKIAETSDEVDRMAAIFLLNCNITIAELRLTMRSVQFNDNWVIVDGLRETGGVAADDDYSTPTWFWTGRRWSSQSARCRLFATEDEAQTEMRNIRNAPNS